MDLYFIALIPHQALRAEISALKNEIFNNTGSKKALNSPAHITLQRPFRRNHEFEVNLISCLKLFASKQKSFKISLSGFDYFEPRVIFVDVLKSKELNILQTNLNLVLLDQLAFEQKELNVHIHPHMTIATRDLSKNAFYKVWPTYKNRRYHGEFTVKSIFLLKHNGTSWDILQEFLFKE